MSTVDILCALYSRLKKQNTILHVKETITLFRFPTGVTVDPAKQRLQQLKYKTIDTIQSLKITIEFINNNIYSDIESLRNKFLTFYTRGSFYDKTRKLTNKKQDPPTRVEQIMTTLVKIRMIDIFAILRQIDIRPEGTLDEINGYITTLETFISTFDQPQDTTYIETIIAGFEQNPISNQIKNLGSVLNITKNQLKILQGGGNHLNLDYDLFNVGIGGNVSFKYTGECDTIKFSNIMYSQIFDTLNKLDRIMNARSDRGKDKGLYEKLHIMEYFTQVNLLFESYFNNVIGSAVYNILQPENNTTQAVTAWYAYLLQNLQGYLDSISPQPQRGGMITTLGRSPKVASSVPRAINAKSIPIPKLVSVPNTSGDLRSPSSSRVQYYELSDLLRNISGRAAAFVESVISENNKVFVNPESVYSNMDGLKKIFSEKNDHLIDIVEDIRFTWINGIMSLQNNIDESYDYQFTISEYIMTSLLGYYWNGMVNMFDSSITDSCYLNFDFNTILSTRELMKLKTVFNDIGHLILTTPVHVEIIIILVLTLFDNTMQIKLNNGREKVGYFLPLITNNNIHSKFFEAKSEWDDLPRYFYSYTNFAITNVLPPLTLLGGKKNSNKITRKNKCKKNKRKSKTTN